MKNIITFLLALILLIVNAQKSEASYAVTLEGDPEYIVKINASDLQSLTDKKFKTQAMKDTQSIMSEVARFKMKVPHAPVRSIEGNTLTPEVIAFMSSAEKGDTITFFDFEPENKGLLEVDQGTNFLIEIQ